MAVEIANSGKPIEFFTVDNWRGSPGETGYEDADLEGGTLFEAFSKNIEPVARYVTPIWGDTVEAAGKFADGSIDFLYVDASHTYAGVMRDLTAWFPKVKVGGVIAGDDWCSEQGHELGVRNAVSDFLGRHARTVEILPGAGSDENWLQWSIIKSADKRDGAKGARSVPIAPPHRARGVHGLRRLLAS